MSNNQEEWVTKNLEIEELMSNVPTVAAHENCVENVVHSSSITPPLSSASWSTSLELYSSQTRNTIATMTPRSPKLPITKVEECVNKENTHKLPCSISLSSFNEEKSDAFSRSAGNNSLLLEGVETFMVGEYNLTACPICLEHFTIDNPAIIVQCEHGFHLQCLESWRQRSNHCPLCLKLLADGDGHIMNTRDYRRRRRYNKTDQVKMRLLSQETLAVEECQEQAFDDIDDEKKKSNEHFNRCAEIDIDNSASVNTIDANRNETIHGNDILHSENVVLIEGEQQNLANHFFRQLRIRQRIRILWQSCTSCFRRADWRQLEEESQWEEGVA